MVSDSAAEIISDMRPPIIPHTIPKISGAERVIFSCCWISYLWKIFYGDFGISTPSLVVYPFLFGVLF